MTNNFEGEETVETVAEDVVEETVEVVDDEVEESEEEETIESLKKKLATTVAQKKHWRDIAEKKDTVATSTSDSSLSSSDLLAVMKANVHEDDMDRVEKFAKMEGVSIKDALKHPELKAILSLREEQRATSNAANVTNVRRGSAKLSDDAIIANAQAGKLPENDEDINRLVAAKLKRK